jgi:hypothetical protein
VSGLFILAGPSFAQVVNGQAGQAGVGDVHQVQARRSGLPA